MASEKILSREEMDALLAGAPADAERRPEERVRRAVKPYDFKRPRLFSSEHLRTLEHMHGDFADDAASDFAALFAVPVKLVFSGFTEPSLQEYLSSLAAGSALYLCSLEPGSVPALVDIAYDLACALVDRLLGGEGTPAAGRPLTDIEFGILGMFVDRWLARYRTPWVLRIPGFAMKTASPIPDLQHPPKTLVGVLESVCLRAGFEVKVGTNIGTVSVCMVQHSLKPFLGAFSGRVSPGAEPPTDRVVTMEHIGEVPLPVCAYLGNVRIRVYDFMKLQRGDIIALGDVENPATVAVGCSSRFHARLGRVKENLAVQLTGAVPTAGGRGTP